MPQVKTVLAINIAMRSFFFACILIFVAASEFLIKILAVMIYSYTYTLRCLKRRLGSFVRMPMFLPLSISPDIAKSSSLISFER